MEEAKTQNGLIGFFDILGYQSFLENVEYMTPLVSGDYKKMSLLNYLVSDGVLAKPNAAEIQLRCTQCNNEA